MRNLRNLFVFVAAVSILALFAGCRNETPAFQVNDVASDPGAFDGSLTVVGIVNAYAQDDASIVGIMDRKELQCTTPNCKKVLLPVKISGTLPAIGEEVRVSGSFSRENWGYLLHAEKMEVLAKHRLGGQG